MNDFEWNLGDDYLEHHGVQGQKWGVRRYQRPDGTLTAAGRKRLAEYAKGSSSSVYYYAKGRNKQNRQEAQDSYYKEYWKTVNSAYKKAGGKGEFYGDGSEAAELIGFDVDAKLWNSYIDAYGKAAIKDAGLQDTKEANEFISEVLRSEKI